MMIILSAVIVLRETCTISPYAQVLPERRAWLDLASPSAMA